MALPRVKNASYLVLGVLLFVVASQVADLAAGATEVGVRVAVLVVAAVGAVVTVAWIVRRRRLTPAAEQPAQVTHDMSPDEPDAA